MKFPWKSEGMFFNMVLTFAETFVKETLTIGSRLASD